MVAVGNLQVDTNQGIVEEIRRADAVSKAKDFAFETHYATRHMFTWQNQLILTALGQCEDILEIGAGIGNFLVDAVTNIRKVHATEVSYETARLAQRRASSITSMILTPAEHLPFSSDSFDAVVARGVLHHLENPMLGIQEIYRVIRPGGRLVIFEGNPASTYRKWMLEIADWIGIKHEVSQYQHLYPDEIRYLLSKFCNIQCLSVSGILAPLAYTGIGGPQAWRILQNGQAFISRLLPNKFNWWLLWIACKQE